MHVPEKCDRCFKKAAIKIMSMFNEDIICMECKDKETKHPKYAEARQVEETMVKNGNTRFKGIGKPEDLK